MSEETPKSDVIVREIDSSEDAVAAVSRSVEPSSVGGSVPVDRRPLTPQLVALARSGITTYKFGSTDRCIRIMTVPTRGGGTVECHCSKACVSVGDQRLCPDHDRESFQPNQTPVAKGRVINSASIRLSKSELKECGAAEDIAPPPPADIRVTHVSPQKTDAMQVSLSFTLDELAGGDILKTFVLKATEALDGLPCVNLKQMKYLSAVQEQVAKIAAGRPSRARRSAPPKGNQL